MLNIMVNSLVRLLQEYFPEIPIYYNPINVIQESCIILQHLTTRETKGLNPHYRIINYHFVVTFLPSSYFNSKDTHIVYTVESSQLDYLMYLLGHVVINVFEETGYESLKKSFVAYPQNFYINCINRVMKLFFEIPISVYTCSELEEIPEETNKYTLEIKVIENE